MGSQFDHVDYDVLDNAKNAFIAASRSTLNFAKKFGFVPNDSLGASANVFSLDLKPFIAAKSESLSITLIPEGLGTADDARPEDLTEAELRRFWHNIGIKTVSVLTNDAATGGMQTVLISLYLPSAFPEKVFTKPFMDGFLGGFVEGCKAVGCVYFSGETPQLKNKFIPDKLDIAGALFGIVPPGSAPITGDDLGAGDQIVHIESSGPHENGFTTLRGLADKLPKGYRTKISDGREYWEAINAGSKLYTPVIQSILAAGIKPTNLENITGHGWQKMMRSKKPLRYRITKTLPILPIFEFIREKLSLTYEDLFKVFNCGTGFAVYVRTESEAVRVVKLCKEHGLVAEHVGVVEEAKAREVQIEPFSVALRGDDFKLAK